ncbi:MAG: hypothetical protein WA919_27130 [Coleofasciculaceae cyanobacterium]
MAEQAIQSHQANHSRIKFTLYNFAQLPTAYYLVERKTLRLKAEALGSNCDYQIFLSNTNRQVIAVSDAVQFQSIQTRDDGIFYQYKLLSKELYNQLTNVPIVQSDQSVLAFARAKLAEGDLNTAKYALLSSLDATLINKYTKALTRSEIADFAKELEQSIFQSSLFLSHKFLSEIKANKKITLLSLLRLLEQHKNSIIINLKHLRENYQRKSLKRIEGKRDEAGELIKPALKVEEVDSSEYLQMGSLTVNHNTATINLLLTKQVRLVQIKDSTQLNEVASLLVNELENFKNYTLVWDGKLAVNSLKIKISSKKVFDLLKTKGVLEQAGLPPEEFDFRTEYELRLNNLPTVAWNQSFHSINGVFDKLAQIKILSSIIAAQLKDQSAIYIPEQLEELESKYLSKNLYINFPTTTEYSNLEEAIASGAVDCQISHKINIGNLEILNLSKLYSANKFLNRLYEAYNKDTGEKLEKLTFDITLEQNLIFGHKNLSSRLKITKVDELMRQIFDNFLGIENNGTVRAILSKVGAENLLELLEAKWRGEEVNLEELIVELVRANTRLKKYADQIYAEKVSPLVFYIGSTGLIPEELDGKAETAEEIGSRYSDLQFSKHEREGIFFAVGESIISVYPDKQYYSTKALV